MFLMTDNQIVKEQFLVYINDLLSTGVVSDLFTPVGVGPACWHLHQAFCSRFAPTLNNNAQPPLPATCPALSLG
jgi:hypothetical protein